MACLQLDFTPLSLDRKKKTKSGDQIGPQARIAGLGILARHKGEHAEVAALLLNQVTFCYII